MDGFDFAKRDLGRLHALRHGIGASDADKFRSFRKSASARGLSRCQRIF